jgi:hypothetical protein
MDLVILTGQDSSRLEENKDRLRIEFGLDFHFYIRNKDNAPWRFNFRHSYIRCITVFSDSLSLSLSASLS